jgi:hypothetical protein
MQPAKNRNKAAGIQRYKLPCDEWWVDEAAWIEIRSGAIFGRGVTRIERHESMTFSELRTPARVTGGFPISEPIRPGSAG